jgi:hypothetical protein
VVIDERPSRLVRRGDSRARLHLVAIFQQVAAARGHHRATTGALSLTYPCLAPVHSASTSAPPAREARRGARYDADRVYTTGTPRHLRCICVLWQIERAHYVSESRMSRSLIFIDHPQSFSLPFAGRVVIKGWLASDRSTEGATILIDDQPVPYRRPHRPDVRAAHSSMQSTGFELVVEPTRPEHTVKIRIDETERIETLWFDLGAANTLSSRSLVFVDYPRSFSFPYFSPVVIEGWLASDRHTDDVVISLDDEPMPYRRPARPDVQAAHPSMHSTGFLLLVEPTRSEHTLKINIDGTEHLRKLSFAVTGRESMGETTVRDFQSNPGLVSIITIFFNGREFFHEAKNSVFKQTYTNWEWLLVDDGSTDGMTAVRRQII